MLSAYDYDNVFKPGNQHANADMFSCLPLADTPAEAPLPREVVLLMECLSTSQSMQDTSRLGLLLHRTVITIT